VIRTLGSAAARGLDAFVHDGTLTDSANKNGNE
jgi:hypothetical protein